MQNVRYGLKQCCKLKRLATAGFYYTGSGDKTLCYYCNGGLRYWEPEDDPWARHAKWFEYCPYLILTKGTEFVSSITGRTYVGADSILLAINKFENIEKFYSEETNTAEVSAVSGEASSEEQFVQGDEPCDKDARSFKICYTREVRIVFMPCGHWRVRSVRKIRRYAAYLVSLLNVLYKRTCHSVFIHVINNPRILL
ncbi:baculoviral IAP repeat-containing protein 7-B-like isoform X2 [Temnothorax curvispinosus]|uniref:Baculoviral IAP repeat-containing protein 7-B-like isoform X2 n=1 Tax=Temnothorax curvispinosus TaxID=300111 RepID=A0A6J1RCZ5_9HYME|nr:baculoviral IAP repeat-containing protein 7-B-like isoform X2 [Temnothorax curvispinosus]